MIITVMMAMRIRVTIIIDNDKKDGGHVNEGIQLSNT